MEVDINWLAVILAAVASMVVGMVWYAKSVFGKKWQALTGVTDEQQKRGGTKAIAWSFVLSIIMAYVLAHVTELSRYYFDVSPIEAGLSTAFWLWLGISMTGMVIHALFEQRPKALTMMTVSSQLVTLLAMGLVIGLVR